VLTLDENIEAFRAYVLIQGLQIFGEQKIEHGYQFTVADQSIRIPVNFYTTGTINVQGKSSQLKIQLQEWVSSRRSSAASLPGSSGAQTDTASRNSRYIVAPAKFQTIREEVIDRYQAAVAYRPTTQEAEVYRAEIQRGTERLTVTQFQTGTLFVQGRSSSLFDELCDALDQRLAQSFADRAARFLPEDTAQSTRTLLDSPTVENDAWSWVQSQLGQSVFNFLWSHDQQTIVSGAGILLAVRDTGRKLAEFSPVVMPFGKTFEGFVTRLAIHLGLAIEDEIRANVRNITIGAWISSINDQLPDPRRYGFVSAHIETAWGSRNKCMHADPQVPMPIRSLDEAIQEINSILRGMQKAYDVFITQRIVLRPKERIVTVQTITSIPPTPMPPSTPPPQQAEAPALGSQADAVLERFEAVDCERLASRLIADGYKVERQEPESGLIWQVRDNQFEIFCPAKRPGRITIRGVGAKEFALRYTDILQPKSKAVLPEQEDELFPEITPIGASGWIGVDESGKGDVFGPLVIAGVFVHPTQTEQLLRLGVQDSKTLSDAAILRLSIEIKRICPQHAILVVEPAEYNLLYERLQNLNRLLAQKHAEAISHLAATTTATRALSDQFGNERLIQDALVAQGCTIALEQRTHAEDDIAVAAASILARASFVTWLEQATRRLGFPLPPGVAQVTIETGRQIVSRHGRRGLAQYAKLHFRTVREML